MPHFENLVLQTAKLDLHHRVHCLDVKCYRPRYFVRCVELLLCFNKLLPGKALVDRLFHGFFDLASLGSSLKKDSFDGAGLCQAGHV